MQADLFGNQVNKGLLNIHFAFPEYFRNTFEKVNCGNELLKAVIRKDTKVSKHYVVTEKHKNNNNKKSIFLS